VWFMKQEKDELHTAPLVFGLDREGVRPKNKISSALIVHHR